MKVQVEDFSCQEFYAMRLSRSRYRPKSYHINWEIDRKTERERDRARKWENEKERDTKERLRNRDSRDRASQGKRENEREREWEREGQQRETPKRDWGRAEERTRKRKTPERDKDYEIERERERERTRQQRDLDLVADIRQDPIFSTERPNPVPREKLFGHSRPDLVEPPIPRFVVPRALEVGDVAADDVGLGDKKLLSQGLDKWSAKMLLPLVSGIQEINEATFASSLSCSTNCWTTPN